MLIVPAGALPPPTLEGLIEEFVTRDGTDYGDSEVATASKVAQVRRLLERGEAVIVWDAEQEQGQIVPRDGLPAELEE